MPADAELFACETLFPFDKVFLYLNGAMHNSILFSILVEHRKNVDAGQSVSRHGSFFVTSSKKLKNVVFMERNARRSGNANRETPVKCLHISYRASEKRL